MKHQAEANDLVQDTVDSWCLRYILSTRLQEKLEPAILPRAFSVTPVLSPSQPGRPPELHVSGRSTRSRGGYGSTRARAKAAHAFFHHELQAAELMCWCILRFPHAPERFRRGLLGIVQDEIRHMQHYAEYIQQLGYEVGAFAVRDWFWERVPKCPSAASFVATMGLGFEAANLDHCQRFAATFDTVGDTKGAALQRKIEEEERPHVRFAAYWYKQWRRDLEFESWRTELPPPLSPLLMRGRNLNLQARLVSGMSDAFCTALEAWPVDAER